MMLSKRLTVVSALLAVLLILWSVAWWIVAGMVERSLLAWAETQRAQGATVEIGALTVAGYPLIVRATVTTPRIATHGLDWRGPALVAEAPLWALGRIGVTLPGEQHLHVAPRNGPSLEVTAGRGGTGHLLMSMAGVVLDGKLAFPGVTLAPEGPAQPKLTVAGLEVTLNQPATPPDDHQQTGLGATLTVQDLQLPDGLPVALGPVVQRAAVAMRVQGRPPQIQPESLTAWSRDGGTVEVDSLTLDWGPLKLGLNGTLALDGALQPMAALSAEIRGAAQALAALKKQLRPNEMTMAHGVIGMLARPDESGEPVIKTPITIQDRTVFVGPLKIAVMPVIAW